MPDRTDITGLLAAAKRGETGAEAQLFSVLHSDLRQLARARLRRSKPCTLLETNALVNEAYLRLHRAGYVRINDRAHFLAYAARVMRSVVVDFVRRRGAARAAADLEALPDRDTLASMNGLGLVYLAQGKYEEAEQVLTPAADTARRILGADNPDTMANENSLAELYHREKKVKQADVLFRELLGARRRVSGTDSPAAAGCFRNFNGWYPTLMSLQHKPGHLTTSGYVFYMNGCTDNESPGGRQFSSRAFQIHTQ
jgi:DNA-directed RNA polymerase specialized sigma24 family protein